MNIPPAAFELIQSNGDVLRFNGDYFWEFHTEESAKSPTGVHTQYDLVRVFYLGKDDEEVTVSIIPKVARIDYPATSPTNYPPRPTRHKYTATCLKCGAEQDAVHGAEWGLIPAPLKHNPLYPDESREEQYGHMRYVEGWNACVAAALKGKE